ncbi:MAG: YbaB/EbfC family nucleoid-associated protein [Kiritimatiellia bacterium]
MSNMFKMLQDAVSARKNLKKIQRELEAKTIEYSAGNGAVRATARGDASLAAIRIDPAAIDPGRADRLEKLVLEAVNGALEGAKKESAEHMQKLMAGMGLPNIPGL